ncbi:MAG: hypothetical protein Q8L97_00665 [Nitrosomonas sp.]|uniref:hypothetical protein n=1 Tax=Nitrosomonas sp. TaxID=42353 RepID=UPI0027303903|nr:hypothetical protein [Nitrosomonas sp.]MDP1548660.1 hypothetical protein [Nitrosomonas sp.]
MKIVGDQLEKWAHIQSESHKKDLFGRSAFNRYYYAAFLITREMLGNYKSEWKRTPHAEIPKLLKSSFSKPVINQMNINQKKGLMTTSEASRLRKKLKTATSELANLLKEAYDARVIADYDPETTITIEGNNISLKFYKLNSASSWADRASGYCKTIYSVRRDVGLD